MGALSEAELATFATLHRARIRGLVAPDALGDVDDVTAAGLLRVTERGGMLTPAGLTRYEELLAAWRETVDLDVVATAYERFLAVNQPVKDACARWQSAPADDPEARFMAVDALGELVERAVPALQRAARAAPRFGDYATRLTAALAHAADGDGRFITDPRVDSVHTIWFECHEDFLVTLGRDREEEGSF